MTQDEIIEMARQSSFSPHSEFEKCLVCNPDSLYHFAKLVAEKEREACAKEADKRLYDFTMLTSNPPQNGSAWSIASAIRARKQA
jgi:hypothetical protein